MQPDYSFDVVYAFTSYNTRDLENACLRTKPEAVLEAYTIQVKLQKLVVRNSTCFN